MPNTTIATVSDFIYSVGGQTDQQGHCYFEQSCIDQKTNFISPLTHYGFLTISGPDTNTFLQGQMTSDLDQVTEQSGQPSSYCTPKGRMVSSFYISQTDSETYLLRMRKSIVEDTQNRLAKYMVFSKAKQYDASDDYIAFGLNGDLVRNTIKQTFGTLPSSKNEVINVDNSLVIQLDDTGTCFECWVTLKNAQHYWNLLSKDINIEGSKNWELNTIKRGIGEITKETIDLFIPQMLNYQITGAISFTKGCYTGQEIVARMHYKGKLKRRMYRVCTGAHLLPGEELFAVDSDKSIGNVVNAVMINNRCEALVVITNDSAAINNNIVNANKHLVEVLSLPYAINNDE